MGPDVDDYRSNNPLYQLKFCPEYYSGTYRWWDEQYRVGNNMLWDHFYPGVAHADGEPLHYYQTVHHDAEMGYKLTKQCDCGKTITVIVPK